MRTTETAPIGRSPRGFEHETTRSTPSDSVRVRSTQTISGILHESQLSLLRTYRFYNTRSTQHNPIFVKTMQVWRGPLRTDIVLTLHTIASGGSWWSFEGNGVVLDMYRRSMLYYTIYICTKDRIHPSVY